MPRINGQNVTVFKKLNIRQNLYIGGQLYTKLGTLSTAGQSFTNLDSLAVDVCYFNGVQVFGDGAALPDDYRGTRLSAINIQQALAIGGLEVENPDVLLYQANVVEYASPSGVSALLQNTSIVAPGDVDEFSIVAWYQFDPRSVDNFIFLADTPSVGQSLLSLQQNNLDNWGLTIRNTANGIVYNSNTWKPTTGVFLPIMISYSNLTGTLQLFQGDHQKLNFSPATTGQVSIGNMQDWQIYGVDGNPSQTLKTGAGAFWLNDEFIDFSIEANRRKFMDENLAPISLGADGSTPTGNQPIIFFSDQQDIADRAAGVNLGTGGNFTQVGQPLVQRVDSYPLSYQPNEVVFPDANTDLTFSGDFGFGGDIDDFTLAFTITPVVDAPDMYFFDVEGTGGVLIRLFTQGTSDTTQLRLFCYNTVGTVIDTAIFSDIYWSDINNATGPDSQMTFVVTRNGGNTIQLVVNGLLIGQVAASATPIGTSTADDVAILGRGIGSTYRGRVTDFFFDTVFYDMTIDADRRKFVTDTGAVVDKGIDGSIPSGNKPLIFLGAEQTATDWNNGTNLGRGPNFVKSGTVITDA